jgi:nitrogen fixation protein NifZ
MIEPRAPKYRWGQAVQACIDLHNDGSYPEQPEQALLVGTGTPGEIVQIGTLVESSVPVYLVEFQTGHVVGCLEEEIAPRQAGHG